MGAQGAQRPKTAILGPGRCASTTRTCTRASPPRTSGRCCCRAVWLGLPLGLNRIIACTATHPIYTGIANIFGILFLKQQCDRTLGWASTSGPRGGAGQFRFNCSACPGPAPACTVEISMSCTSDPFSCANVALNKTEPDGPGTQNQSGLVRRHCPPPPPPLLSLFATTAVDRCRPRPPCRCGRSRTS
jgi:hypothetical protein